PRSSSGPPRLAVSQPEGETPPMEFSVRHADPPDAEAVAAISVHGWQWGYRGLLPDRVLQGLDIAQRAEGWRAVMSAHDRGATVYLAERDGRPVGFVACGPAREPDGDDGTGEVYAIYIEEDAAGTGVGTALLDRAVDDLRARGFDRAELWVLET